MKQNKKTYSNIKNACKAHREAEIAFYGKIISIRPSVVHKSKKKYDRKNDRKNINLDYYE